MTKIPKFLTTIRVSELNGVTQQIVNEYSKGDYSTDDLLSQLFAQLTDLNTQLGIAILRDTAESELAELDDVTDSIFTLLHGLAKGYTCHPTEAIADAATQLFKMIDKYGLEVKSKSYREEYPLLRSLIAESKTETYAARIAALSGCDVRFSQLETAVDNFMTKQLAYLSVKDDEKNRSSATVIKKQLIAFINDEVAPYLGVMQKVNATLYGQLAQFTANRIAESNVVVRKRSSKVVAEE